MKYFEYKHLHSDLHSIGRAFYELAWKINDAIPDGPDRDRAFLKLIEARDWALRAAFNQ